MAHPPLSKLYQAKAKLEKRHSDTLRDAKKDEDEEFEKRVKAALKSYRFIRLPEVRALTTLSTSEIYRRIAAGTFPKQVKLGPKSSVWPLSAVLDFIDENVRKSREELD